MLIEWNFMVIISVWVLVNINCHLSWKWMDKWLPALVINPLVWGLFFVNYNWLHITVNFFDSVCDIDFCDWSSSGSLFGRFQACFYTEVFGTTGQRWGYTCGWLFPGEVWSDRTADKEAVCYTYQSAICCVWGELCGMLD